MTHADDARKLMLMSKRIQVLVEDADLKRMRQVARMNGLTLAAWARQVLLDACRRHSAADPETKRAALKRAMAHSFPTADIEQMNDEIERGYRTGLP